MGLVLFINGGLGLRVLEYLQGNPDNEIIAVVVNSQNKRAFHYLEEVQEIVLDNCPVIVWEDGKRQLEELNAQLNSSSKGVSVLFGHIIPKQLIEKFPGQILNLHPSLLPIGRGANPISWNIMEGEAQGITLHHIDENLDAGGIIHQKEISTDISMSAGQIYDVAMSELFKSFVQVFPDWVNGKLKELPQGRSKTSIHNSTELKRLQILNEQEYSSFGSFVRRLQATTFSDGRRPLFQDSNGTMWEVDFKILPCPRKEMLGEQT